MKESYGEGLASRTGPEIMRAKVVRLWRSGSQAPLLGPGPLRTGRDGFPSSGSSTSDAPVGETRLGNRKTQAMNPVMAIGMKQDAVLGTGRTTHHPRDAVMKAPSGETGDFSLAHRAEAALVIPKKAK
jgi:hypothetical protein